MIDIKNEPNITQINAQEVALQYIVTVRCVESADGAGIGPSIVYSKRRIETERGTHGELTVS